MNRVKKYFVYRGDRLGNADRNNSMKQEEGAKTMSKTIPTLKDFNDGELGADGFKIGKVSAVANCLYLMFEWV